MINCTSSIVPSEIEHNGKEGEEPYYQNDIPTKIKELEKQRKLLYKEN